MSNIYKYFTLKFVVFKACVVNVHKLGRLEITTRTKRKENIEEGSQEPRRRAKKLKFSRIEEGDWGEEKINANALSFIYSGLEQHSMGKRDGVGGGEQGQQGGI